MNQRTKLMALAMTLLAPSFALADLPKLWVEIENASPAVGSVEISLFNSEDTFMKEPFLQNSGPVNEDGTFSAVFSALPEGTYAVVVVHDENDNGKLETGFLGFGAETWAYSNDASSWFGRPSFEDASFTIEKNLQITISLD